MGLATSWMLAADSGPRLRAYPIQVAAPRWGGRLREGAVWPDREFPLLGLEYRRVSAPAFGPDAPPVVLEVDDEGAFEAAARASLATLTQTLLLAGPRVPAAAVRAVEQPPRLLRVVESRGRSDLQLLEAASQGLESLVRSGVFAALFRRYRIEANARRTERFLLDALPPWPSRKGRAPLATTLWAHVHGVAGLGFPGPTLLPMQLGVCAETYCRARRAIPTVLVEALRSGHGSPSEMEFDAVMATFDALEDALRAQHHDWLGDPRVALHEAERRTLTAGLEADGGCLAATARRLDVGEERLRRASRRPPERRAG